MPDVDETKAMAELANFSSQQDFFSMEFLWASLSKSLSPTAWWTGLCRQCQLTKVASRVLELPCTSAACERSFSAHANIHSRKRNRLTHERAEKLVFVSQNLSLTEPTKKNYTFDQHSTPLPVLRQEDDEGIPTTSRSTPSKHSQTPNDDSTSSDAESDSCTSSCIPYDDMTDYSSEDSDVE